LVYRRQPSWISPWVITRPSGFGASILRSIGALVLSNTGTEGDEEGQEERVIELITTRGTDYFINETLVEALPRGTMRGSPGCFCY